MYNSSVSTPLVSVIIAAYGAPDYLNRALESVLEQTFTDYEIIVVDDASGEEVTSRYCLPEGARLICREKRFGAAAATRNTGIREARGKYIALLDQDDVWLPRKLEAQVRALEDDPKAGLVFCHYTAVDESLDPLPQQRKARRRVRNPLKKLIRGCFIRTPSAVLIRKDTLDQCGVFDENIVGASDWDLWLRIARKYHFTVVPEAVILYRMHPGQLHKRRPMMRTAVLKIMDKTLDWAEKERPELKNHVRRCYCRVLRKIAKVQMNEESDPQGALETLQRARSLWPWNLRTYGLMAMALIISRKVTTD